MRPLLQLADAWRVEAQHLRTRYSMVHLSKLCETHAEELAQAIQAWQTEALDLKTAAEESGYSVSQLRRLLGEKIENVGRNGSPLVRRGDLPRKPNQSCGSRGAASPDLVARARRRADRAEAGSRG